MLSFNFHKKKTVGMKEIKSEKKPLWKQWYNAYMLPLSEWPFLTIVSSSESLPG